MKQLPIVLSSLALAGVAALLVLHFSGSKANQIGSNKPNNAAQASGAFKIAYFEMDSIQNNYEYFKQVVKELGVSEQSKRNELNARKNSLYSKAKEYQEKASSMSEAELERARQDIAAKERDFQAFEASKAQEMQDENFKKLQEVKKRIEEYLKTYSQEKGYAFVFANTTNASEMYYRDTVYNITADLIKGLNESFKKKN
ncbi:MAG: OmpH family outer membrane protein [Chitinophagaceae bacterium]